MTRAGSDYSAYQNLQHFRLGTPLDVTGKDQLVLMLFGYQDDQHLMPVMMSADLMRSEPFWEVNIDG